MNINNTISMPLQPNVSASKIAQQGLSEGAERLAQHADTIAKSQVPATEPSDFIEQMNQAPQPSIEESLVGLTTDKNQMLSLIKVLEIEQKIFEETLGKIVNTKA